MSTLVKQEYSNRLFIRSPDIHTLPVFHLAMAVTDLEATKNFFTKYFDCIIGRTSMSSAILNFFGHQLVAQKSSSENPWDQKGIYPRHLGIVFNSESTFTDLMQKLKDKGCLFFQEPRIRHDNTVTKHWTCFIQEPSGNMLEFKFYFNSSAMFGEVDSNCLGDQQI